MHYRCPSVLTNADQLPNNMYVCIYGNGIHYGTVVTTSFDRIMVLDYWSKGSLMNRRWITASKLKKKQKEKKKKTIIYKSCHKEFILTNITLENWKFITDNYSQLSCVLKLLLSNICIIRSTESTKWRKCVLTIVALNDKNIQTF